uniref:Uncharacterized protein n=1 Tax=Anguilla anguilla TaxID=7936 RepID=A0A0E9V6K4_ANGAN
MLNYLFKLFEHVPWLLCIYQILVNTYRWDCCGIVLSAIICSLPKKQK